MNQQPGGEEAVSEPAGPEEGKQSDQGGQVSLTESKTTGFSSFSSGRRDTGMLRVQERS